MTLIFCFTRIFRNSHRQIFGLDRLLEEGYEIILLDMTRLYGAHPTSDDELMLKLRKQCSSKDELVEFRKELQAGPVIYICNDTYLSFAQEAFQILVKDQDRLLAFKTKPSPFQIQTDEGLKLFLKKFFIKSPVSPYVLSKPLYQRSHKYFVPDYFLCTTKHDLPLKALLTVKKDNIIVAHSDDVNEILEDDTEAQKKERIGVFLDQVLPFAYRGEIDEDIYYKNIEETLKKLKEHFELDRIVVAEHPESAALVEELQGRYAGFERRRGRTQNLIKKATYVFAHYSTSIGIAVYYEKPIVLLIDDNLRNVQWISKAINTYRKILNLPVVDMQARELQDLKGYSTDKKFYRNYVRKYMKDSSVNEKSYFYAIRKIEKDLKDDKTFS